MEGLTPSSAGGAVVLCVFVVRAVHGLRICRQVSERGGRSPIEMSWVAKSIMVNYNFFFFPFFRSNTVRSCIAFVQFVCFHGQNLR